MKTGAQTAGEWVVEVAPGVTLQQVMNVYRALGIVQARSISRTHFWLKFPPASSPSEIQLRETGTSLAASVQPGFGYQAIDSEGTALK